MPSISLIESTPTRDVVVDTFEVTAGTRALMLTAERSNGKAETDNRAAYDALFADNADHTMIYAGSNLREAIKDVVIQTLTAAQRKLLNTPASDIDSKAKQAEKDALGKKISARVGDYKRALKSRWVKNNPEKAKAEAEKASKARKESAKDSAAKTETEDSPVKELAKQMEAFLSAVKHAESYFNAANITKTGNAFLKELNKQPK